MKIRNGFVSNSSSSSFVLIVDLEEHKRALEKVEDVHNVLAEIFVGSKLKRFNGKDVLVITGGNYEDCSVIGNLSHDDVEYDKNKYEDEYEYWEEVVQKVWEEYKSNVPANSLIEVWSDR